MSNPRRWAIDAIGSVVMMLFLAALAAYAALRHFFLH
jgi:hypothetical protein